MHFFLIALCELDNRLIYVGIHTGTDVASNAPAVQYSTYRNTYATNALDGSLWSVACTIYIGMNAQQWWSVDLGRPRHINVVQVTGDGDSRFRKYQFNSSKKSLDLR